MKVKNILTKTMLSLLIIGGITSCSKDDDEVTPSPDNLKSVSYHYKFNTGQLDPSLAYNGNHAKTLSADMLLEEQADGKTKITVTLNNTVNGETYHIHAHDVADPSTTPNGTPYNETPNSAVFVDHIDGNGSSVSTSKVSDLSITELTTSYSGFFVVHDPLQALNTKDPKTFIVLGTFARKQFEKARFTYAFNTGQIDSSLAYNGQHSSNLSVDMLLEEQSDGKTKITITLNNTINGETYHIHAHDMADPNSTPNGTPYNETPNSAVFVDHIDGNGASVSTSKISDYSVTELTTSYDGFFVVHDPLQALNTKNPKTFVVLGVFARE